MTIAAETAIVGWNPVTRTWSAQEGEPDTVPVPPEVRGLLHGADEWLAWAADDWGHLVSYRPRAVLTPSRPDQVAALVSWAHDQHITVAARGGAHSLWGQAQVRGGVVIDMSGLSTIEDIATDPINRMTVQAGALWTSVLTRAIAHRRTPPVLTDFLSTSVGGTLSAGGVGGSSHQLGFQVDQVSALEVATPRGGLLWCTPHRNRDVFDAVRAGHGQVGVITRVELVLVPAPEQVRWHRLYYSQLETFLADARQIVRDKRFRYVEGQIQPEDGSWSFMLEAVAFLDAARHDDEDEDEDPVTADLNHERPHSTVETTDYYEFADRMGPVVKLESATGAWSWPHPCLTTFVPDEHVTDVVEATLKQITPEDVGLGGVVLFYPVVPAAVQAPLLRLPDSEIAWLFGLQRKAPPDQPRLVESWLAGNREFLDRVRNAGGHAYHVNAMPTSSPEWRAHYGSAWETIATAKYNHDPHLILAPGQTMFVEDA